MTTFFHRFVSQLYPQFSVIIEDNGQVAYAYLLEDNKLVGDVWLYNQADSPVEVNWHDKEAMPFLNPVKYAGDNQSVAPLDDESNVHISWGFNESTASVQIYLYGNLTARLASGSKPGWSVLAVLDGPLAKVLR